VTDPPRIGILWITVSLCLSGTDGRFKIVNVGRGRRTGFGVMSGGVLQ